MHNVKRGSISEAKRAALTARAKEYTKLSEHAMACRRGRQFDAHALESTERVLKLNVEFYSMWNFRKEILQHMHGSEPPEAVVNGELELTQAALGQNPKAYCVWHHRWWCIGWCEGDWPLPRELKLCSKLLQLDARNFHCWQYRRLVAARAQCTPAEELAFVAAKIQEDFSNYSAWHYRSKTLEDLGPMDPARLEEEFTLVRNALFTAPDDSSAWFYHRWLLDTSAHLISADGPGAEATRCVLRAELAVAEELIAEEAKSRWPKVAAARICLVLGGSAELTRGASLVDELPHLDPMRAVCYARLRDQVQVAMAARSQTVRAGSQR